VGRFGTWRGEKTSAVADRVPCHDSQCVPRESHLHALGDQYELQRMVLVIDRRSHRLLGVPEKCSHDQGKVWGQVPVSYEITCEICGEI